MKKIKLTQGKYAIVDDEDYPVLSRFKWTYAEINNSISIVRSITTKFGEDSIAFIDQFMPRKMGGKYILFFKNGNRLDYRKENIFFDRVGLIKQRGRRLKNKYSSIYKGVIYNKTCKKKWVAQIMKNKITYRGYFNSEREAGEFYNKKARELYGKFAYQNKIK